MKVLSIGTDRKLFEEGSAVLERQKEYAGKMDELHIIIFSLKSGGFKEKHIEKLHIYPTNSLSRWFYIRDAIKIGKEIILKNGLNKGYSVITVQDPFETGLVGVKLKKIFNIPLQIQIHTDFLSPYFKNSFLNRVRVFISKFTIPKADGIRVVSYVINQKLENKKIKSDILPVFVDVEKIFNEKPKKDLKKDFSQFDQIVFMASRLTKEKRIDVALSVFKKVIGQFPKTGLVIAGDGSEKNNLERLASQLGISKNVIFLGWQNDVISCYKTSDVFLCTSDYEGYGMSLVEAQASGCPIVTTKVGVANSSIIISTHNRFCEIGDTDCLTKNILYILEIFSDGSRRELFRHQIQDNIKNVAISREEYVEKYVGLLDKLTKEHGIHK